MIEWRALADGTFSGTYAISPDGSGTFNDSLAFVTNGSQIYAITQAAGSEAQKRKSLWCAESGTRAYFVVVSGILSFGKDNPLSPLDKVI